MAGPENDQSLNVFYPFHTQLDDVNKELSEDFRLYIFDEVLDDQILGNLAT